MNATMLLWRLCAKLPERVVTSLMHLVADAVTVANPQSVKQLRKNHERLAGRPLTKGEVRQAVRSYFRMFGQEFTLANWDEARLHGSCTYRQAAQIAEDLANGPVVLALTHSGNWDLAGAWFCKFHGQILTVAEKLADPNLLRQFVELRESMGLEILTVGPGEHIFEQLVERAQGRPLLVPLLADRDIAGSGVEVTLGGHRALVAAGPAALALRLGRPLIAGHIHYEKIGKNWNIRATFTDPIPVPEAGEGESPVEALTREWMRRVEPAMIEYVRDWHMMQKVFVDDLDAQRLERARRRHRAAVSAEAAGGVGVVTADAPVDAPAEPTSAKPQPGVTP